MASSVLAPGFVHGDHGYLLFFYSETQYFDLDTSILNEQCWHSTTHTLEKKAHDWLMDQGMRDQLEKAKKEEEEEEKRNEVVGITVKPLKLSRVLAKISPHCYASSPDGTDFGEILSVEKWSHHKEYEVGICWKPLRLDGPRLKIHKQEMKAKKREAMGRDTLESAAKQRWNEEATQKYIAGLQRKLYSVSQELVEEKRATREMKEQDLLRQRLEGTVVKSLVKPDPMARIAADFKRVQTELVHMHMELAEKDSKLAEKDLKLAEKDSKLAEKDSELERRATDWLTKEIVLEGQIFDLKSQSNQKPSSSGDSSLHATIDKLKEEKATLEGQKNNFRSMMLELAQENSAYKKREETMKEFCKKTYNL